MINRGTIFRWKTDKSGIPHKPGVYIYKDSSGRILYVGKAVDLYHRVASYFNGKPDHPKTAALVEHIASCETVVVDSELEALILEANLIKRHLPPYNIRLMDDKDYLYIKITKEEFPRVVTARKSDLGDAKDSFGPFPSSRVVRSTLKRVRRFFPWCNNPFPKDHRPCFHYHLGLCPGACAGKISRAEYNRTVRRFCKFMQGKRRELVGDLEKEMKTHSDNLHFEKAQAAKRLMEGVNYLTQSNNAQIYLENPNFLEDQNRLSIENLKKDLALP
ncbi:MAG: GIY-YIG nuclease family protein, partial [bacterium]|nr:GIY-YIG nuclease family protein [bacterium]